MKNIIIDEQIKKAANNLKLFIISSNIKYKKHNSKLWTEIEKQTKKKSKLSTEEIKKIPQISSTRQVYKKLGKEPSRYRPSAEALYRRIVKGKGMYRINNLVDTVNLASISTAYSIGGYDYDKIKGKIKFTKGKAEDEYKAIGRGLFNIKNLPVFYDKTGPFGSPTSDSERTMITEKTSKILLIVMDFDKNINFENDTELIKNYVKKYCFGTNIYTKIL